MNDKLLLTVLLHLRAMWKYRWRGLYTAFGVALLGVLIVMIVPKRYEASARIFANTDSILKPLMAGMTVQPDINQRVVMLSRVVISRPNVEHIIQATGLDEKVKTAEQREKLVDEVMKYLELQRSPERGANIYVVKFKDTKPERAKHVVELLVSMFIDTSKGGGETDAGAAKAFLDEQVALYEKKLRDAENRLKEFKLHNIDGTAPAEGRDFLTQMATVGEQLNQAQLQLHEAENSRDAFRRGLAGEDLAAAPAGNIGAMGADNLVDIDARIDSQKRSLDGLLQRYTESHPDVVGARRVIRELEEQRQRLVESYRKAGIPLTQAVTTGPRASEQIKVSLAQAEANVASLRARVADYSARHRQLREMARRMPEYEAELAQLNRDYEVNKRNYENLISRREQANISGDMQAVAGVADFRLVDPPRVAPGAVSPNRLLLIALSLVVAIGAGIGTMFVSKEVRPCVYDRQQLRAVSGLPILGVVSLVDNDQLRGERKRDLRRLLNVAGGLLAAYTLLVGTMLLLTRAA
ncbi:MAG: chain length-determining protein [Rhodocyclales bacterium]|nr:chain length-determining protein [Rhodocyclales bacterium]